MKLLLSIDIILPGLRLLDILLELGLIESQGLGKEAPLLARNVQMVVDLRV